MIIILVLYIKAVPLQPKVLNEHYNLTILSTVKKILFSIFKEIFFLGVKN